MREFLIYWVSLGSRTIGVDGTMKAMLSQQF